jgi:hypothetical protein
MQDTGWVKTMRPFKPTKFTELETRSITRSLPTRYCDRCHLSTPRANPRCIHCRSVLPTTNPPTGSIETRVA